MVREIGKKVIITKILIDVNPKQEIICNLTTNVCNVQVFISFRSLDCVTHYFSVSNCSGKIMLRYGLLPHSAVVQFQYYKLLSKRNMIPFHRTSFLTGRRVPLINIRYIISQIENKHSNETNKIFMMNKRKQYQPKNIFNFNQTG